MGTPDYITVSGNTAFVADGSGLVILSLPIEIENVTMNSETSLSLTLPIPQTAGRYTVGVFNGKEYAELPGTVTFIPKDTDSDGHPDESDAFPEDPDEWFDSDNDGTGDNADECPTDPGKTAPGLCGCGSPDTDSDNDGTLDCDDECPDDPNKTAPGLCGCGIPDISSDSDGILDCNDAFPYNPDEWLDSDSDGMGDNADAFPRDSSEWLDSDNDGTGDNADECPNDPNKTKPGFCGCGIRETDCEGALKFESVEPNVGMVGRDLDVTLTGASFDEHTRVSMYIDPMNRKSTIGSVGGLENAYGVAVSGENVFVAEKSGPLSLLLWRRGWIRPRTRRPELHTP